MLERLDGLPGKIGIDESNKQNSVVLIGVLIGLLLLTLGFRVRAPEPLPEPNIVFNGLVGDVIEMEDYNLAVTDVSSPDGLNVTVKTTFVDTGLTATGPEIFLVCTTDDEQPSTFGKQTESTYTPTETLMDGDNSTSFRFEKECESIRYIKFEDVRSGDTRWVRLLD